MSDDDFSPQKDANIRAIYKAIMQIPRGRVAAYGEIAKLAGLPGRARLVGHVLAQSPDELEACWHRVVNAQGKLSLPPGTAGYRRQRSRLKAEGVVFENERISLRRYGWRRGDAPVID